MKIIGVSLVGNAEFESTEAGWLEPIHQQWVATLDAIRDAVFVVNADNRLIRANKSFAELADTPVASLRNLGLDDVLPWLVEKDGSVVDNHAFEPNGRTFKVRRCTGGLNFIGQLYILEDVSEHNMLERAEKKYREGTAKSLMEAIEALSNALEARDPYTAAHSVNVANLSRKLAIQMGLNDFEAQGVFLGAKIHDIGKLSIPSGILSKPGKLLPAEKSLIRLHCESGYAMVKHMKFPWSVDKIVLQHHERLDGSGYPAGLKGDEIELSAKIVAVADVFEAMSSHRPYREALGIEAAVEELRNGRGVTYDPVVVDACLQVLESSDDPLRDGQKSERARRNLKYYSQC